MRFYCAQPVNTVLAKFEPTTLWYAVLSSRRSNASNHLASRKRRTLWDYIIKILAFAHLFLSFFLNWKSWKLSFYWKIGNLVNKHILQKPGICHFRQKIWKNLSKTIFTYKATKLWLDARIFHKDKNFWSPQKKPHNKTHWSNITV